MATDNRHESSKRDYSHRVTRIRTCIATRQRLPDHQLLRIVAGSAHPTQLIPDPQRRLAGRGCWITPTIEALELAQRRNAFSRALRVSAPVDTGLVRQYLTATTLDLDIGKKTEH